MSRFTLDIHRQFTIRVCSIDQLRNEWKISLNYCGFPQTKRIVLLTVMPVVVGILVMLAFMTSSPIQGNKFLFFSTMYAFWVGIFGGCQSLNGEVASGEWSYWVLGNRFKVFPHVLAVAIVSFFSAVFQVFIFAITVICVEGFLVPGTLVTVINAGDFQLFHPDNNGSSGMLTAKAYWVFCIFIYILSLIAAVLSGSSIGLLLSGCFKDTMSSVRTAVAIIVIQTVMSATVLEREHQFPLLGIICVPDSEKSSNQTSLQKSAFLKDVKIRGVPLPILGRHKGDALLEDVSLIAPQRYFYNISRVLHDDVAGLNFDVSRETCSLNQAFTRHQKLWEKIQKWTNSDSDTRLKPCDNQFMSFALFLILHLVLPEVSALVLISLSCIVVCCYKVKNEDIYHVLR